MPFIYYKGGDTDIWDTNTNWCFNPNGTNVLPANQWPWRANYDGEGSPLPSSYANYDLALANGVAQPSFLQRQSEINDDITGTCNVNFAPYNPEITYQLYISSGNYPCVIYAINVSIYGGNYTGGYITDFSSNVIIRGGNFSGGWVFVGSDGNGNTTLSLDPNISPITFKYPTPPSGGGGGGLDIGQLIGLPAFIKV
jgi:hypothetical protein